MTTHETVAVAGADLSCDVTRGAGPTVVVLHGLGSSRANEDAGGFTDWSPLVRGGRRLVRYDARSHGRSTGRPEPSDHTWSHLADDLLALLDVVSPEEPVDAVGSSMGTGTVLHAALRRPDRFRRLVLVVPPTAWATRTAQVEGYLALASVAETQGRQAVLAEMDAGEPLPLLAAGGWASPPMDVAAHLIPAVLRGAAGSDLPEPALLASLAQPTLLCPWVGDPGHPESTALILADALPDAHLDLTRTPEDLRRLGDRVLAFLGNR